MKITSIDTIPLRLKRDEAYLGGLPPGVENKIYFQRPPYRALYTRYYETIFVKITTDEGVIGWGEALAPVAPEVVATIIDQLLTPVLQGQDPLSTDHLWSTMYNLMRERGYYGGFMLDAISACDIALWDIKGKFLDQPVSRLLGGPYRESIPCYVSGLPKPTDAERVQLAEEWVQQGFWALKLAAGYGVERDIRSIKVLRDALGPDACLLLDAHWVYSLDESVQLGHGLEQQRTAVLEAPMNPEDINAHAKLADALAIPIAIGETERTRYQFKPWLVQRGADLLQPDAGRVGISELVKIAHMAEAFNIPVAPHLSVGLGPCIAASIHVAAAIHNLWMLEYQPPTVALANSLLETDLICERGQFTLPEGSGLGITIDERKVQAAQA
jgi:L-alanine-DL-glutamate epimerase-like enolase superfamily enzyme